MAENIFNGGGKEEIISVKSSSEADSRFDEIVGCIQDILLDTAFTEMLHEFLEEHYHNFEDSEENKFVYTDIFRQYNEVIECYLENILKVRIPDFSMEDFLDTLKSRRDEVGEEIIDMLTSFTDFLAFKQTILNYKSDKEGKSLDLGGLVVNSLSSMENGR